MPTKLTKKYSSFSDIFIVPQYSEVLSREQVDTSVKLGPLTLKLPVISANMPSITGVDMAVEMAEHGGLGILPRFDSIESAVADFQAVSLQTPNPVGVSIGVQEIDKKRFIDLFLAGARIFCVDVAHGDHKLVKDMIRWIRLNWSGRGRCTVWNGLDKDIPPIIIAGNIASTDAVKYLLEWGADIIKVGVGPGCFTEDMQVVTKNGNIAIKNINNGDFVLSHDGQFHRVINTIKYLVKEKLRKINGIKCTKHHEFYVVMKTDVGKINDNNLNDYAKWVSADVLDEKLHLLVRFDNA